MTQLLNVCQLFFFNLPSAFFRKCILKIFCCKHNFAKFFHNGIFFHLRFKPLQQNFKKGITSSYPESHSIETFSPSATENLEYRPKRLIGSSQALTQRPNEGSENKQKKWKLNKNCGRFHCVRRPLNFPYQLSCRRLL